LRIGLAAAFEHDGLEYGGEVIVPNLTFIASATACLDRRFGVAFVDVDEETLMLDPASVEDAIVPGRTRAIMPVHQFGHPCDMTALTGIADRHGLKIIEDAAQAHGAEWNGRRVGGFGNVGAFSFQSSKSLSAGEGGALTTNDPEIYDRARSIYNAGRAPDGDGRWEHPNLGWNCRPTEMQAALLLHRLSRFDAMQRQRAENFESLRELLPSDGAIVPLGQLADVTRHGMYMFALRFRPERSRETNLDTVLAALRAEGAPINRLYTATISDQPVMKKLARLRPEYVRCLPTPVADEAVRNILYISHEVFLGPRRDMVDIAAAVAKIQAHYGR
jgi:dTDP-4-amino-4,6-dideoxygalactose transaminase